MQLEGRWDKGVVCELVDVWCGEMDDSYLQSGTVHFDHSETCIVAQCRNCPSAHALPLSEMLFDFLTFQMEFAGRFFCPLFFFF